MAFKPTYVHRKSCFPLYSVCIKLSRFQSRRLQNVYQNIYMCRDTTKGTLRRENQKFSIACSRRYSAGHFGKKIMYLEQVLTELLQILSFKTCLLKN